MRTSRARFAPLLAAVTALASAACDPDHGSGPGGAGTGGGGGSGAEVSAVFALHWDAVAMVEQFGTVDIATAVFSPIANIPGVTSISGEVVLDPGARTYSFAGAPGTVGHPGETYITLDLDSGAVISAATIGNWFNNPEYDPVTGNVFALRWDEINLVEQLGTVDVATAAFSPIADIPGVTMIQGEMVLRSAQRTYSFIRAPGPGEPDGHTYVTLDLDSGAVVSEAPLRGYFNNAEYDPVTGNVFALRWDEVARVEQFGTVDVATAAFSPIADIPGVTMIQGDQVLDPVGRTYFFVRAPGPGEPPGNAYVTLDLDTGAVLSTPTLLEYFNYPQALR